MIVVASKIDALQKSAPAEAPKSHQTKAEKTKEIGEDERSIGCREEGSASRQVGK